MKTIVCLLVVALAGLNLLAADTTPKKPKAQSSAEIEALAKTLAPSQRASLLDLLNRGDDSKLLEIPGIGPTRAAAIRKARPFNDITDVVQVEGIGPVTFSEMVAHAQAGFPPNARKQAPKKKKKSPGTTAAAGQPGTCPPASPPWTPAVQPLQNPLIHRDVAAFKP